MTWSPRNPWERGPRGFVLDPIGLVERLVALIPHPGERPLTDRGVLVPASPLRDDVGVRRNAAAPAGVERSGTNPGEP